MNDELKTLHKCIGILECYVMMSARKDDPTTNDYIFASLENLENIINKISESNNANQKQAIFPTSY